MHISSSKIKSLAHFILEVFGEQFANSHQVTTGYEVSCLKSFCCTREQPSLLCIYLVSFVALGWNLCEISHVDKTRPLQLSCNLDISCHRVSTLLV